MKKINLLLFIFFLGITSLFAQVNQNKVWVNGYYKSNGTYVKGHYRTAPNNSNRDNYSTKPNINPHTGEKGTLEPDKKTLYNNSEYNYNQNSKSNSYNKSNSNSFYNSNSSTTSVQCSGITQQGNRCRRKTTNVNGRCYQH